MDTEITFILRIQGQLLSDVRNKDVVVVVDKNSYNELRLRNARTNIT